MARSTNSEERFVAATLDLISESGRSEGVNLRAVARRVGCAHTNLYNYFPSYRHLLWEAFRRVLAHYGDQVSAGLDPSLDPAEYLQRLIANLAAYPEQHPGWYRFIASDPIDPEAIPPDILDTVGRMKAWLTEAIRMAANQDLDSRDASRIANIALSYIDGETMNLINSRVVPGEDVKGRVVENAVLLIGILAREISNGRRTPAAVRPGYPLMSAFIPRRGD